MESFTVILSPGPISSDIFCGKNNLIGKDEDQLAKYYDPLLQSLKKMRNSYYIFEQILPVSRQMLSWELQGLK